MSVQRRLVAGSDPADPGQRFPTGLVGGMRIVRPLRDHAAAPDGAEPQPYDRLTPAAIVSIFLRAPARAPMPR